MDSLDLHPEELFDKATRGVASSDELARIDAHLVSCAACRFERQVRVDFDAVTLGSPEDLDDLVARALSGAKSESVPVRRSRRIAPLLAAAIVLMGVGSLAAVGQVTGVLPHLIEQLTGSSVDRTPVVPPKSPSVPRSSAVPVPVPVVQPVVVPEIPAVVAEELPVPKKPAPRVVKSAPVPVSVVSEVDDTPSIPAVVIAEPDALTLFSRAQRERVQGETAAAIRDFRSVVARYPTARESALANAELGRLLLDRGEATSALESFDAYLASSDTVLREDVLGGRAMALGALGRVTAERQAWEVLLHDYPSGVYAPRARARLESLAP